MSQNREVVIVMPAYNAAKTLEITYKNLPKVYDHVILCDDFSMDETLTASRTLGIETISHDVNKGYGGNQKTLYDAALKRDCDVIVMVHPDNQYETPRLPEMIEMIRSGKADMVLGSRMTTARKNGMPWWRLLSNRFLTILQNKAFGTHLSEFHSGLRAYRASLLASIDYHSFSDDFVFDSQMIAAIIAHNYKIGEVEVECIYHDEVSSINFGRSVKYGLETLKTLFKR